MYPFKPSIVRVSISSRSAYFCTIRMKWQHKKNNKHHTLLSRFARIIKTTHRFSSPRSQNLPRRWSWQYHHRAHRARAADNLPSSPRRRRRRQSRPHSGKVSLGAAKRKIIINDKDDKDKHSKRLALLRRNDRKNSEKTSTPCRISEPRRTK